MQRHSSSRLGGWFGSSRDEPGKRVKWPFPALTMVIQHLFSTSVNWVRIRRQRDTNEFLIVSSVNILMSKRGGSPGDLATAKQRGWLDQLRAADFLVAAGGQTGLNQFASGVKEKCRIPVSGHVDARPVYQVGHGAGLPDF